MSIKVPHKGHLFIMFPSNDKESASKKILSLCHPTKLHKLSKSSALE